MTDLNTILIFPTIDLFVYQLAEGLGQDDSAIAQNRQSFWHKIYGDTIPPGRLDQSRHLELTASDYIYLLKNTEEKLFPEPHDGFYNPVKIGDTYALQINCSSDKNKALAPFAPRAIKGSFQTIKKILDKYYHAPDDAHQTLNFGQTWFVWGQLISDKQDPNAIAKSIYEQLNLFDNLPWEDEESDQPAAIPIHPSQPLFFERWQLPSDRGDIRQNRHLVIALLPPDQHPEKTIVTTINPLYPDLIRLFLSRHKIIWTYNRSRQYKANLKNAAKEVQKRVKKLPEKIEQSIRGDLKVDLGALQQELADTLNLMSSYAETLSYLEEQKNTIETNLKNHQRMITALNLTALNGFIPIVTDKYLPQITSDLASLGSGLKLLENTVRTIEGIINIEQAKSDRALNETIYQTGLNQAKSDRALNETIFAASAALATSQIIGSVLIAYYPPPKNSNFLNYGGSIFGGSILFGFVVFWLVRKILPR